MSLLVWIPMVHGDCKDQGLLGVETSVVNTVTYVDGKLGKAVQIGNGNQVTNGISINTNLVEELGTQYSCSVWVKPLGNHVHYEGAIISSGDWNKKCWAFGVNQDNSKVDIFCGGYNRNVTCSVPINQWTHLVSVNNGTYVNLYKNGELVSTTSVSSWPLDSDATNTTIGRETYAGGYFSFNGCIQDLRIYDHALSPLEVKHLAQGLVLHYPLSDASNDAKRNLAPASYWTGTKTITLSANTNNYKFINNPTVDVNTNTTYFWTVDIRVVSGGENLTLVAIDTNCTGGSYSGNDSAHTVVTIQNPNLTELKAGKWQTAYCITTVKSDATNPKIFHSIFGKSSTSVNAVIEWRNLMLVESNNIVPFRAWHSDIVYDTSGFCNNGTVNGQFSISTDTPRYNVSTYASGSASTYLSGSTLPAEAKTVSLWIKCNKTVNSAIFSDKTSGLQIGLLNSLLYINSLASTPGFTTTNWVNDEWNHVVAINDNGSRSVYINGQPETQSGASNYYIHNNDNFYLWKRAYNDSYTYTGALSDLRIYATALSPDDVMALYKNAGYVDSDGNVYAYEMTE